MSINYYAINHMLEDGVAIIDEYEEAAQKIREELKYYLNINEEKGVVYIPKFAVENMIKRLM